jgi:hypothetical protein
MRARLVGLQAEAPELGVGQDGKPSQIEFPNITFYLPEADTFGQCFLVYLLQVTAFSVTFAWVYWRTNGSLLITMLLHSAINNTKDIVPAIPRAPTNPFVVSASLLQWLGVALLWIVATYFLVRMRGVKSIPAGAVAADVQAS